MNPHCRGVISEYDKVLLAAAATTNIFTKPPYGVDPGGGDEGDKDNERPSAIVEGVHDHDRRRGRVSLGQQGWRVCLTLTLFPVILPCRAHRQHRNITELYPVDSTQTEKVGLSRLLAEVENGG